VTDGLAEGTDGLTEGLGEGVAGEALEEKGSGVVSGSGVVGGDAGEVSGESAGAGSGVAVAAVTAGGGGGGSDREHPSTVVTIINAIIATPARALPFIVACLLSIRCLRAKKVQKGCHAAA
jgi:hypothetical protein